MSNEDNFVGSVAGMILCPVCLLYEVEVRWSYPYALEEPIYGYVNGLQIPFSKKIYYDYIVASTLSLSMTL